MMVYDTPAQPVWGWPGRPDRRPSWHRSVIEARPGSREACSDVGCIFPVFSRDILYTPLTVMTVYDGFIAECTGRGRPGHRKVICI